MNQIFSNGNATNLFVSSDKTLSEVCEWINISIFSEGNLFDLNEQHSCSAGVFDDEIHIDGDEDLKILTLEEITSIF